MKLQKVMTMTVVVVVLLVGVISVGNLQEYLPANIEGSLVDLSEVFNVMSIGIIVVTAVAILSGVLGVMSGSESSDDWEPSSVEFPSEDQIYLSRIEEKTTRYLDCTVCGAPHDPGKVEGQCSYCGHTLPLQEILT